MDIVYIVYILLTIALISVSTEFLKVLAKLITCQADKKDKKITALA